MIFILAFIEGKPGERSPYDPVGFSSKSSESSSNKFSVIEQVSFIAIFSILNT